MVPRPGAARASNRLAYPFMQLLSLAAVLLAGCAPDAKVDAAAPSSLAPPTVTVTRVVKLPIAEKLSASGILRPREEAAVGPEVAGYQVADVLVEEGALVTAGQVLATLHADLLRAKIDQARAALAQAQALAEQARAEFDRVKDLDARNVMSQEQVAARRYQARTSEAAVGVARAQLDELLTQEQRLTVRAPVSGLVLERNIRPGDVASLAQPMFRIARDNLIELDAEVPEDVIARISLGDAATVSLPSGEHLDGEVRLISPRIDPETKLGRVRVSLASHPQLRAGGYARVDFHRPFNAVPAIAEKALQWEANGPRLTTIDKENRARPVAVRIGARDGEYVTLVQGPSVGTRVALGSGVTLLEGDLVNPVEADDTAATTAQAESAP